MIITKTIRAGRGVHVNPFVPDISELLARSYECPELPNWPGWEAEFCGWENVQLVIATRDVTVGDAFVPALRDQRRPKRITAAIIPGTNERSDWLRGNLRLARHEIGGIPGKWRHGFELGGEWVWHRLRQAAGPDDALIIAGHSYGAGMAKNAAAFAARSGDSDRVAALLDFAGPRTTNAAGAEYLDRHYPPPIGQRFGLGFDVVPWSVLPVGWRHALDPIFIGADGRVRKAYSFWREFWPALRRRGLQAVGDHGMANYAFWAAQLPAPVPVG